MIPLRDIIPSRTTPVVTISLIVVNVLVFLFELSLGPDVEQLTHAFGLIPADFSWVTVFTSMFLHGGLMHAGGNMLYLWIFGDNVEDRMGHGRFLVFYLLCGVAAALGQTVVAVRKDVPIVLSKVANIVFAPKNMRGDASINGKPGVIMSIQKQPGVSTVELDRKR